MATRSEWYGELYADAIMQGLVEGINAGATLVLRETTRRLTLTGTGAINVTPSRPGSPPGNQTGNLSRNINVVPATRSNMRAVVGTNVEYARIHELGGTIRPTRARYLGIPVGVHGRRMIRDANGSWRAALQDPQLSTRRSRGGSLVTIHPDHGVVIVWKNQVTMPRRPFLRPSFESQKQRIGRVVANRIQARLRSVRPGGAA